jgi:hypothetical protein
MYFLSLDSVLDLDGDSQGSEATANTCIDKLVNLEAVLEKEKRGIKDYTPSAPIIGLESTAHGNGKVNSVDSNDDDEIEEDEEEEEEIDSDTEEVEDEEEEDNDESPGDNDVSSVVDMMEELDDSGEVEIASSPESRGSRSI